MQTRRRYFGTVGPPSDRRRTRLPTSGWLSPRVFLASTGPGLPAPAPRFLFLLGVRWQTRPASIFPLSVHGRKLVAIGKGKNSPRGTLFAALIRTGSPPTVSCLRPAAYRSLAVSASKAYGSHETGNSAHFFSIAASRSLTSSFLLVRRHLATIPAMSWGVTPCWGPWVKVADLKLPERHPGALRVPLLCCRCRRENGFKLSNRDTSFIEHSGISVNHALGLGFSA
jgi:hypothetical protein